MLQFTVLGWRSRFNQERDSRMTWRLLVRKQLGSATDLPMSRRLSTTILFFHPRSGDINHRKGGVTEGNSTGRSPAECGRTLSKVWQIVTPAPGQPEAKTKVCLMAVNDPHFGENWPFEALRYSDNRLCQPTFMNIPGMVGLSFL